MIERSLQTLTLLTFMLLAAPAPPAAAQTPAKAEPLAEVDGKVITAGEVETALGSQLATLEEQIYSLKRQKLDVLIAERLLAAEAARRGISAEALVEAEVTAKAQVTPQEVEDFFQANRARLGGDETVLRERIKAYLQYQQVTARREALLQALRPKAQVTVRLKPRPIFRATVAAEGAPSRGPATAPVTIVEFSDFHCPFCQKVQPTISQLLARYGDKVRLVYRHLPAESLHAGAGRAAEAAQCAADQGKFWAYHDKLYANRPDVSPEKLKAWAGEVNLDVAAFGSCLASGKHSAGVRKDVAEGGRLGVEGTPAFFINGRLLSGAQPLENFVRVIEEELAQPQH